MGESTSPESSRGRPFKKGKSGNPAGRPQGARNRATLAAEALLDGEAEALTRKAVALALEGDRFVLRMCLDRVLPPRRERYVNFNLPPMKSAEDSVHAMNAIADAVASGEITVGEAAEIGKFVESFVKVIEAAEFDQRLKQLEMERPDFLELREDAQRKVLEVEDAQRNDASFGSDRGVSVSNSQGCGDLERV